MACAITEPGNYPDYLKAILKKIAVGNDDEAKACACSLISPTTDEGCLITDEDGKLLAFPFCLDTTAPNIDPNYQSLDLALTYKQAMKFYWATTMKVEYALKASISFQRDGCGPSVRTWTIEKKASAQVIQTPKQLVCRVTKGAPAIGYKGGVLASCPPNETCIILQRPATVTECGLTWNYDGYAGGGVFVFANNGWLDRTNKKIYPYVMGGFNLYGYAGFPFAKNGKWNGNGVSFDLITTDIGLNTPIGVNCGTATMTLT